MKLTLKISNAIDRIEMQKMLAKVSEHIGFGATRGHVKGAAFASGSVAELRWNLSDIGSEPDGAPAEVTAEA